MRVARVPGIDNPPFYREIGRVVLDFTGMTAITFADTVVLNRRFVEGPAPAGLLFHELVHVVQYDVLGVDEFTRLYVGGWAAGGFSYRDIPLERMAYRLQAEFEAGTLQGGVHDLVVTTLGPVTG